MTATEPEPSGSTARIQVEQGLMIFVGALGQSEATVTFFAFLQASGGLLNGKSFGKRFDCRVLEYTDRLHDLRQYVRANAFKSRTTKTVSFSMLNPKRPPVEIQGAPQLLLDINAS